MKCSRDDLFWAASQNILSVDQAELLWSALEKRNQGATKFDLVNVLYYAGAVVVILAMGWFLANNWDKIGPQGIFAVSAIYSLLFYVSGRFLWKNPELKIPGGLLVTLCACMVPLMTYALIGMSGFWGTNEYHFIGSYRHLDSFWWIVVHASLALAAAIMLYFIRFPFLTAPLSFAIWAIATTAPGLLDFDSSDCRLQISIYYGLIMLMVAYGIDLRRIRHRDFAFWLYLFGSFSLWTGMQFASKGQVTEFIFFLGYVAMMLFSVLLQRKALMVFGAFGVIAYIFHLSWHIFHNSPLFPMVLVVCGLSTITCGVIIQKYRDQLRSTIFGAIPPSWREFLPEHS